MFICPDGPRNASENGFEEEITYRCFVIFHQNVRPTRHAGLFNSLPNDKILNLSKLKAFVDGKMSMTLKLKFVLGRVENIVGEGENAGYQHFLLFPQCFQKSSSPGSLKVVIVW